MLLPIIVLAAYTFRSQSSGKVNPKKLIPVTEKLKLITPTESSDEIAQYINDNDFETASLKIDELLVDPNIPTTGGFPLITIAAAKNSNDLVNLLIARGADVNFAEVNSGETALMKAAANGNTDMVTVLLSSNANVNAQSKRGVTPLTAAVEANNSIMANLLISSGARAGVSKENVLNYAFRKHPLGVDIMLKGGAEPDYADANGNTALIVTAAAGDGPSVKALVDYRADNNAANKNGMTPLLYAVKNKKTDVANYLINHSRTDINKANNKGENALYWAAYLGQDELVNNLLLLNADYKKLTNNGVSALQIAQKNGHPKTAKIISDYIAFKSIPRDAKGKPIIPKKQAAAAQKTTAANTGKQQGVTTTNSSMNDVLGGIDISAQKQMTPEQAQAMAAAQQQGAIPPEVQAMISQQQGANQQSGAASQSNMQPKKLTMRKPKEQTQQRTVINKLRTSSL